MSGFGGASAFSDGKYKTLPMISALSMSISEKKTAIELMEYVDGVTSVLAGRGTKLVFHCGNKIQENLYAARPASSECFRSTIWVRILIILFWSTSMIIWKNK